MDNSGTIIWKEKEVGKVTDVNMDMWYMEGNWHPYHSEDASKFENVAKKLKAEDVIKTPSKGFVAVLKYDNASSGRNQILVLSLNQSKLFVRLINDEIAAYVDLNLLAPWQETNNPSFYETELKKELSFFHPLNWKKARVIGIRADRDDILLEMPNGRYKYAIVHLTWNRENSRKFPITQFYKNQEDLYIRLASDHQEWREGNQ